MLNVWWVSGGKRQQCRKLKERRRGREREYVEMMIDGEIMRQRYQRMSLSKCSVCCLHIQTAADRHWEIWVNNADFSLSCVLKCWSVILKAFP